MNESLETRNDEAEVADHAPEVAKPPKKQHYHEKVANMSDRQISGELRRKLKNPDTPQINEILAVVLTVMFDNHRAGRSMYVG